MANLQIKNENHFHIIGRAEKKSRAVAKILWIGYSNGAYGYVTCFGICAGMRTEN
jgi:hypothetical protein